MAYGFQKVIAQALGIAQGIVLKVLKRNRETGVPTRKARPGRLRKTTEREDRYLLRLPPEFQNEHIKCFVTYHGRSSRNVLTLLTLLTLCVCHSNHVMNN